MMTHPRVFLLDENMPRRVLTSLCREGFSAVRVYDVGLRSQSDTTIFAYLNRGGNAARTVSLP